MTPQEIGAELHRIRVARQLSQREAGQRAGLSHTAVQNVERGERASDDAVAAVARVLGREYHVARTLTPVGARTTSMIIATHEADHIVELLGRPDEQRAALVEMLQLLLSLDDYHRELVMGQVRLMATHQRSATRKA